MAVPDTIKCMFKRHRSSCCGLGINKKSHLSTVHGGGGYTVRMREWFPGDRQTENGTSVLQPQETEFSQQLE